MWTRSTVRTSSSSCSGSSTCSTPAIPLLYCRRRSSSSSWAGVGYPMVSRRRKRSSWESGSRAVPAAPTGFWVAMTMKGRGTGWLTPSTVTWPSSMASSRADWVRLVARLSSSARKRLHSTAPGWYSIRPVSRRYREKPVISEGITSGVNCTRLNRSPRALAKARAMVVFPTPGMSSSRMWPPARMAASTFTSTASFPTMTFFTSATTAEARSLSLIFRLLPISCISGSAGSSSIFSHPPAAANHTRGIFLQMYRKPVILDAAEGGPGPFAPFRMTGMSYPPVLRQPHCS